MTTLDWIVIAAYGIGMLAIGAFYSLRTRNSEDYHLGNRQMRSWMVGLSLFASLLSTVSYLSLPGEIIRYGPMILASILAYPLIILVVGWFLIPRFMKLRITSAYEVLEERLGLGIRLLGSAIFVLQRLLWMTLVTYATCDKVLVPIMGLDASATPWLTAALAGITLVYTSMGGLRAVVLTDVIQTFILFFGLVLAIVLVSMKLGGVSAWIPTSWDPSWQKPVLFDFNSRMSLVGMLVASFSWFVCTSGSDQIAIQRYLATRDARAARRAFITNMIAGTVVLLFLGALGFALLAFYAQEVGGGGALPDADLLFPHFIAHELPPGLSGLIVAGLLAAAMSSLSSGINSSCTVIAVDFIERFRGKAASERRRIWMDRGIAALIGLATVALSQFIIYVPGNLIAVSHRVANLLVAPLFMLFFLALFVRGSCPLSAWMATAVSVTTAVLVAYWEPLTGHPGISFLWIMPASFAGGVLAGILTILLRRGLRGWPLARG